MGIKPKFHVTDLWAIVPVAIVGCFIGEVVYVTRSVEAVATVRAKTGTIELGVASPGSSYALSIAIKNPAELHAGEAVAVTVNDAQGELDRKWLHSADLDFYLTLRPRAAGALRVSLSSSSGTDLPHVTTTLAKIPQLTSESSNSSSHAIIAAGPNGT